MIHLGVLVIDLATALLATILISLQHPMFEVHVARTLLLVVTREGDFQFVILVLDKCPRFIFFRAAIVQFHRDTRESG
jgi:hypothetical protein